MPLSETGSNLNTLLLLLRHHPHHRGGRRQPQRHRHHRRGNALDEPARPSALLPDTRAFDTQRRPPCAACPASAEWWGCKGPACLPVTAGSVAVLGLRFDGPAFTSIPTTPGPGNVVAQRELAQNGSAIRTRVHRAADSVRHSRRDHRTEHPLHGDHRRRQRAMVSRERLTVILRQRVRASPHRHQPQHHGDECRRWGWRPSSKPQPTAG